MHYQTVARIRSQLLPPPEESPQCRHCSGPSKQLTARPDNPNGNAYRPYYKCDRCRRFLGFADSRGNLPDNPDCCCDTPSKVQVANKNRELHFVCRLGVCSYYAVSQNQNGERLRLGNCAWAREFHEDKLI